MITSPSPLKVFISYARADERLRKRLDKYLAALSHQGLIEVWHDRCIDPGSDWNDEIARELEVADLILLLVSADFLASGYIRAVELRRAIERHRASSAYVVPVILAPSPWQRSLFGNLQALPKDGEPVSSPKWRPRDAALHNIAENIAQLAEKFIRDGTSETLAGKACGNREIWGIHARRNPNFIGRSALLETIRTMLSNGNCVALTGPGGVGKSHLALEYAYRARDRHNVVWWLRAGEPETLAADYANLTLTLGLPAAQVADQAVHIDAARRWLASNSNWLLVFDNADSPSALRDYLPQAECGGAIIVTSRKPQWDGFAEALAVEPLPLDEAASILTKRTSAGSRSAAAALAQDLGRLPLALTQAAAYIEGTGGSLKKYRDLTATRSSSLFAARADYPDAVATTWSLAIEQTDEAARELLDLFAFFAPDAIPMTLIAAGAKLLPGSLSQTAADAFALEAVISELQCFSLIGRKGDELQRAPTGSSTSS